MKDESGGLLTFILHPSSFILHPSSFLAAFIRPQGAVDGMTQRFADALLADRVDFLPAALEGLDDAPVPLNPRPLHQDLLDPAAWHGIPMRPGRAHGVVG